MPVQPTASLAVLMVVATPALGSGPVVRATAWTSVAVLAAAVALAVASRSARLRRLIGAAGLRHLVQVLGGRIWTEAAREGGQVFTIAIPRES